MPVDVSTYPTAQVAPADPLAMLGKVLQIQGAQQQLQVQQQEFKARQALGPILQQSIDPQTGELDINKFLVHGAANPDVAWKMPEITLQMIQRQNTQADTVLKGITASKEKYGAFTAAALALEEQAMNAAKSKINPDGTPAVPRISLKDMANALAPLPNDYLSPSEKIEYLTNFSKMDDKQRFQAIQTIARTGQNIDKGLDAVRGKITSHDTGGETTFAKEVPATGTVQNIGNIPHSPSIESRNAPFTGITGQGQPTTQPRVQAYPMVDAAGRPVPGSPTEGPIISGLSPMERELQTARAKSANEFEEGLVKANTTGQENLRILREMQSALQKFKTGGGAEVREKMGGMLDALGFPKTMVDKAAGGDRGAIQEFQKLAIRYATQEMQTNMGSGQRYTNLDFSTFLKNNPTIATDPRGLDKMFRFLENGVKRAENQQDMHQQWKSGWRPKGFENTGMDSFPAWWTKILAHVNAPAPPEQK